MFFFLFSWSGEKREDQPEDEAAAGSCAGLQQGITAKIKLKIRTHNCKICLLSSLPSQLGVSRFEIVKMLPVSGGRQGCHAR
jgi:hypothetical protein